MNYTIGPPGLDNLDFQWFSNLHCKSGVLPVISERMGKQFLGGACVASDSSGICQICWTGLRSVGVGGWGFLVR